MLRLLAVLIMLPLPGWCESNPDWDILILGEVHDNADAHRRQAEEIARIQPTAVILEMLLPEAAELANADLSMMPEIWADTGFPPFDLYRPIFESLGDAEIVGAAAPRETVMSIFDNGPAPLFGEDAARFGLIEPLPETEQDAREELQFIAHCEAMPKEMMAGMVAIQRFRDAHFARATLTALETFGPPVVLITGNGHARTDWGVPAVIARASPEVTTYSIAFAEADEGIAFDELHIVPEAERPAPCDQLTSRQD